MKNPLTPAGIEPATFRFAAHHFNHCATLPRSTYVRYIAKDTFNFVHKFCSEHLSFILRRTERDMSEVYIGLHVQCPIFWSDFHET